MPTEKTNTTVTFTGYPIKTVRELLGIKRETFRYWRANLDPNPFRSRFMPTDILVYRIMKLFIQKRRVQVKELSIYDWSDIFSVCKKNSYKKLKEYMAVLDDENKTLELLGADIKIDYLNVDLAIVPLSKIIDDHINEFSRPRIRFHKTNIIHLEKLR